jgi:TetR/AcrR family transcriptional regulator, transcriptional repressor for nem operon
VSKHFSDRGKQTRQKILATAATLIYEQGAHPTSIDEVLAASGTGKSQFYHYFKSKAHLVREVIVYQLNQLVAEQRSFLECLDTWAGIEAWFNFIVDWHRQRGFIGGCPIGSLAAELADCDPELRATLAAGFDCWESFLKRGLSAMRTRGDLRPDADPDVLAEATLAAIQGGILLAKTKKDERPLRNALAVALVSLRSYASDQAQSAPVQTIGGGIS